MGRWLVLVVLIISSIIVLAGWLRGKQDLWHMLEIGISLAIAATPEGLLAVATMTLAIGMRRMAKVGALIRRLGAVETLGSTTVICSDKTGTLTMNEMTVRELVVGGRKISVTGTGYAAVGEFSENGRVIPAGSDPGLSLMLEIAALCNDARVQHEGAQHVVQGDPTEGALIVAAEKAGVDMAKLIQGHQRIGEIPFESALKRMVTIHRRADGTLRAMVKGSPGTLLAASSQQWEQSGATPLTEDGRQIWEEANRSLATAALRVLGLAFKDLPSQYREEELVTGLTFVGLVGLLDPLRAEAQQAIATCRDAGIRTVMITGDQPATAAEIARQLGIDRDAQGQLKKTVHGRDLENLDSAGWDRMAAETAVFARVSPGHKLQIVEAFQRQGHIVAMTGDGVNDAPALKKADIGVAMGRKGTEVAKEAADMVITDDNFATIVGAIERGRIVYANILRFILYLFSCNFAELLTVFLAMMLSWSLPIGPLQILWLNMITDVFPALSLALEPSAPGMMRQAPRRPEENLLELGTIVQIIWQGCLLAGVTLLAFHAGMRMHGDSAEGLRHAMTMAFMTLALSQVFHAFNVRSRTRSMFSAGIFANAWLWGAVLICVLLQLAAVHFAVLQRVLGTTWPSGREWLVILGYSLLPIPVVELVKLGKRIFAGRAA